MKSTKDRQNKNFRQQENAARKAESNVETVANKQFEQARSAVEVISNEPKQQGRLRKQYDSQTEHTAFEFQQQESTVSKIGRTLETNEQQQLAHSSSAFVNINSPESPSKSENASSGNSKLQKRFSDQAREEFRQQESTVNKIDKVLQTEQQQQFANSASNITQEANDVNSKFYKPNGSAKQKKYKLHKEIGKGSLTTASSALKSGVHKYQAELEKDDEAVKFTSQSATYTAKLSSTGIRKLREKKLEKSNFKKAKENPLSKELPKESSLKKIAKVPPTILKSGATKYQEELEQGDEGVKLASQGSTQIARATKKLAKGSAKINAQSGKLGKPNSKITQFSLQRNKQLKKETKKAVLKKKVVRKKMYYAPNATNRKRRVAASVMSSFTGRMGQLFKDIARINRIIVTKVLGAKAAAALGSGIAAVLPLIMVAALVLVLVGILGETSNQQQQLIGTKNLSPEVEQWRWLVEQEAAAEGMEKYVGLLLAIMQVETGGKGTRDIMQSSESAGYPRNYWSTEEESVRQAVKHLKNIVNIVKPFGLEDNYQLLAQAYNFGSAFASYVAKLGGSYTLDVAEKYSRDVVAPSLGNHSGETYSYVNGTSQRLGKTYLYRNGGNFLYGELVMEYLGGGAGITGEFRVVVDELEKYLGMAYVWGGKSPSTGFDCSGFVSHGLAQIGINLPSYAASQYELTVPIDPSEARPGDLIFFKGTYGGPNHVSHVGFYIDNNTMLDSNGSGVGYTNWKDPYWSQHYAGIRRVVSR